MSGQPVILPLELIDRPGGSPLAVNDGVYPDAESVAATWKSTALPAVVLRFPGDVTVTFPGVTSQVNDTEAGTTAVAADGVTVTL